MGPYEDGSSTSESFFESKETVWSHGRGGILPALIGLGRKDRFTISMQTQVEVEQFEGFPVEIRFRLKRTCSFSLNLLLKSGKR